LVEGQDLSFEEYVISAALGLSLPGLDPVVGAFPGAGGAAWLTYLPR
jgi:hypothetical protein